MENFSSWDFYRLRYCGALSEAEYAAAAPRARAEITCRTGGAARAGAGMDEPLAMCECELADAIHAYAEAPAGVAGVTNDGYAVSYRGGAGRGAALHAVCARWLCAPRNLMCGWL